MIEIRVLAAASWRLWWELRLAALAEAPAAFTSRLAEWRDADEERWRARLAIPGPVNFADAAEVAGTLDGGRMAMVMVMVKQLRPPPGNSYRPKA